MNTPRSYIVLEGAAASAYRRMPEVFQPAFAELMHSGLSLGDVQELVAQRGVVQASRIAQDMRRMRLKAGK